MRDKKHACRLKNCITASAAVDAKHTRVTNQTAREKIGSGKSTYTVLLAELGAKLCRHDLRASRRIGGEVRLARGAAGGAHGCDTQAHKNDTIARTRQSAVHREKIAHSATAARALQTIAFQSGNQKQRSDAAWEGAQNKTNGKRKVTDTKETTAAKNTEAMAKAHRHGEDHVDTDERHAPVLNFMANSGLNSGAAHAGSDESHSGCGLEQQRRTGAAEKK